MRTLISPVLAGGKYKIVVPDGWDGTLILYSQGPPAPRDDPVWRTSRTIDAFLARRYAVGGWASPMFWPLEQSFDMQMGVLDAFAADVGAPALTVAYGESIGGIITAGLVQTHGDRLDGALPLCGPIAGGIGTHNRELDIAFAFKVLLAPDSAIELVRISDPEANVALAISALDAAARTPDGRARLALIAAIGNVPAVADPRTGGPEPHDPQTRLDAQVRWFRDIVFLVTFSARATVERRAGGNPAWNSNVDYASLLHRSRSRDLVERLYADVGLDLASDLSRLASASRVEADPDSVRYLERYVVFDGLLSVPVVTMHTTGDGLCTPEHEHAYSDVVRAAGRSDHLRQLWLTRGGHCTFTIAETLTAFDVLRERIRSGEWPSTEPEDLNAAARLQPTGYRTLADPRRPDEAIAREPEFGRYEPMPFSRPYDARMVPAL